MEDSGEEVFYDSTEVADLVLKFDVVECKEPEISLHAISGYSGSKSMRLLGLLHNYQVSILIDSGSTHNFLDPSVLSKLQLPVTSAPLLRVKIADGTSIPSYGKTNMVSLKVQGHSISASFYVISLGGLRYCPWVGMVVYLRPDFMGFSSPDHALYFWRFTHFSHWFEPFRGFPGG
jgi:hypothetical protein